MSFSFRAALISLAAAAGLAPAALSAAEKLDKDAKKWLEEVRPIILPDEEKTFRGLKDKSEREEFQKIFWARRDPDLDHARQRVPDRIRGGQGRRRPAVPGERARGLRHRLRARLHPAGRPRRREEGTGDGRRGLADARDLDLPRPAGDEVHGRPGPDHVRRRVPAPPGSAARAADERGGGREDREPQHRLPHGKRRAAGEAGGPAPQAQRGHRAAQVAAAGLHGRGAEQDVPAQPGRDRLRGRARAWGRRGHGGPGGRREEDREGGGRRPGRGRERQDRGRHRARDGGGGGPGQLVRGVLRHGAEAGLVHPQRGGRSKRAARRAP